MKHFLSIETLERDRMVPILRATGDYKNRATSPAQPLAGQKWVLIFSKPSTRTCHFDRSGEYGVRGRRRMDCIARLVKRASVSGERESNLLLLAWQFLLVETVRDVSTTLDMTRRYRRRDHETFSQHRKSRAG